MRSSWRRRDPSARIGRNWINQEVEEHRSTRDHKMMQPGASPSTHLSIILFIHMLNNNKKSKKLAADVMLCKFEKD